MGKQICQFDIGEKNVVNFTEKRKRNEKRKELEANSIMYTREPAQASCLTLAWHQPADRAGRRVTSRRLLDGVQHRLPRPEPPQPDGGTARLDASAARGVPGGGILKLQQADDREDPAGVAIALPGGAAAAVAASAPPSSGGRGDQ